jgi:electron transfer flavoprotein beta subunit
MHIIVCVKQVPDPEAPPGVYGVDAEGRQVALRRGTSWVLNPYDENAVEAALRLKDSHGGKVTLLGLGPPQWQDFLQEAMGTGADEAVLLSDPAFEGGDGFATAYVLAKGIQKIGDYDLVICGRQAADTDAGIVGSCIAENLGLPCVTIARSIEVSDRKARVERLLEDGYEVLELALPAVITVTSEMLKPRYATMDTIMAATQREVPLWNAQDLGADPALAGPAGSRLRQVHLSVAQTRVECQMVEGEDEAEKAEKLVALLRANKVL